MSLVLAVAFPNGSRHATINDEMTEPTNPNKSSRLPDTSTQIVRQRWLELFDSSYSARRVTRLEIEPGVNAVVVPVTCGEASDRNLIEAEIRIASASVPGMAMPLRFALEQVGEFVTTTPSDYDDWMGEWGKDIAAGKTQVSVFVDLAYLEAALLARLWDHGVIVDFGSPMAFFRRGSLTDYADIHEAAISMVTAGRSLADTADHLAPQILARLQRYANAYLHLSSLYVQAEWQIDHDNFVIKVRDSGNSLVLQYWRLREEHSADSKVMRDWRRRVDKLLQNAIPAPDLEFPKSFAA
jgi:hypothetical protein